MTTRARVIFTCGCGFRSDEAILAEAHADDTGHTLAVTGSVVPEDREYSRSVSRARAELTQTKLANQMWWEADNPESPFHETAQSMRRTRHDS